MPESYMPRVIYLCIIYLRAISLKLCHTWDSRIPESCPCLKVFGIPESCIPESYIPERGIYLRARCLRVTFMRVMYLRDVYRIV